MPTIPATPKPFTAVGFLAELEALGEIDVRIKLAQDHWPTNTHMYGLALEFIELKKQDREEAAHKEQIEIQAKSANAAERSAKAAEDATKIAQEALEIAKRADQKANTNLIFAFVMALAAAWALWKT